jgi:hypothetical protein
MNASNGINDHLYNVPERKLSAMLFIKNGSLRIWTLDKMTSTQKLTASRKRMRR